jgi:hypothetical protein
MRFGVADETDERVEPVDLGVLWDIGAPMPHLLQREDHAFLVFYLREPDQAKVPDVGVIEWFFCGGAALGGLNDEAFAGHPLYGRGLDRLGYEAGEVRGSRWIAEWEQANRVHRDHSTARFAGYRHFILAFHDSTFECVAGGFISYRTGKRLDQVVSELARCVVEEVAAPYEVALEDRVWRPRGPAA